MPLVSNPNYADAYVCFDVANLVGRCEKCPSGTLRNRCGYPTNSVHIGLAKVRLAAELADYKKKRVCLVCSDYENSQVRRDLYPQYKLNRVKTPDEYYAIAGTREVKFQDGRRIVFDYARDDVRVLSQLDVVSAGPTSNAVMQLYDGVRDFMSVMSCIPSLSLGVPDQDGETDDALATFTHLARPKPCYVVTEDRDIWATMSTRVHLVAKPDKVYGIPDLQARFGIDEPDKLPLAKALYGDDTDNIDKAVGQVTDNSVGVYLRRCQLAPGEKLYTYAFLREIAAELPNSKGKFAKMFTELLAHEQEIVHLEKLTRLRRVRLSYQQNALDVDRLQAWLDWYGITNQEKTLTFARTCV